MDDEFKERMNATREAYLKAKTNKNDISYHFSQVILHSMRAFVEQDRNHASLDAAKEFGLVLELNSRLEEPMLLNEIFRMAIKHLDYTKNENYWADAYDLDGLAEDGLKYLIERTRCDEASSGRLSKRISSLRSSAKFALETRKSKGGSIEL